jgi:hypothetical protein
MDTVARAEIVESELDAMIRRRDTRHRETEGHRPSEELYEESIRAFNAQRQESLARQWLEYHQRRQRAHRHTFALLDAHHEAEIERYATILGIDKEPKGEE